MSALLRRAKKLLVVKTRALLNYEFVITYNANDNVEDKENALIVVLRLYE